MADEKDSKTKQEEEMGKCKRSEFKKDIDSRLALIEARDLAYPPQTLEEKSFARWIRLVIGYGMHPTQGGQTWPGCPKPGMFAKKEVS